MTTGHPTAHDFRSVLSLDPLLDFWRNHVVPMCPHTASMFEAAAGHLEANDAIGGQELDPAKMRQHLAHLVPLMTAVFPSSTWESDLATAVTPLDNRPFFYTPLFERYFLPDDGRMRGTLKQPQVDTAVFQRLRAFWLILDKVYGIVQGRSIPVVRTIVDPETGLDRHYRMLPDWQFLRVATQGRLEPLSDRDRAAILENIDDPEVLARLVPAQRFEFQGFIVIRAVDITQSEVLADLERGLIDQETIFCSDGFGRLQQRLRILFGRPDLRAGLGALHGDQVWVVNDQEHSAANCIFKNSNHVRVADLQGSMWLRAVNQRDMLIVPDLADGQRLSPAEQELLDLGFRSALIVPLIYQGSIIGTFFILSPRPNDFDAMDKLLIKPTVPLFSMALKRGVDDIHNEVQAIIKEKCTALHPSVEWRFRQAAFSHLERRHMGEASELEPIVFKDVIPLYGQTDIRGSSEARSRSIQADLTEQLRLAREVFERAGQIKSWPLIRQFDYRIAQRIDQLRQGLPTGAESEMIAFLKQEAEPTFEELLRIGPRVAQAVENYRRALDPRHGFVYRERQAYETSVSLLNARLSAYLEQAEAAAQKEYPHYFEKHQTDGLDYVIYLGQAMREDGHFTAFHLQNLILWQLILACGMAWHTEQTKPELSVPLDTCHLIFYSTTPLSIRFRYDEKRFDVDGAYDVRHEIVKSRLDKAVVKGSGERLTQPGRIAIVYAHAHEAEEMRQHLHYLQSNEHLLEDIEPLELEDLPSVKGLKALRVGVNLEAPALARQVTLVAAG